MMRRSCASALLARALLLGGPSAARRRPRAGPAVTGAGRRRTRGVTARNPDDPKGWVLLGLAYLDRNEDPRALEAFQRAVKAGPGVC